jgi:DNA-binding NarL/FixJ family response regulator
MSIEPRDTEGPIRILLVDDHPAIREGLALLLAPEGISVCADASTTAHALVCADSLRPDVALIDLSLGGEDGLALVAALHARGMRLLVYSMYDDVKHVKDAFAAGALGYVTKRELHRVLVDAIRAVATGGRFVSPNAALVLAEQPIEPPAQDIDRLLSDQERQVYHLLGQGEGTQKIADAMAISPRTVESYYARIQDKLHLTGMHALRRHAIAHERQ